MKKMTINKNYVAAAVFLAAAQGSYAQCISGNCKDGYGTYQDAKQRYTGFFNSNMKPDGYGVKNYVSGASYIGQFSDGKFSKTGTYFWNDGTRYIGHWQDGKRQGVGIEIQSDGTTNTDIYVDGNIDETVKKGGVNGDVKNGWGVYIYDDGSIYEGYFKRGEKDGYGKYTMTDGSIYQGEFQKDRFEGYGVLTEPDGNKVEGLFEHGRFAGALKNQNGCISGDCYSGYGVLADNEKTYFGEFKEGKQHGMGRLVQKDGMVYEGSFVRGNLEGYATITYPDSLRPDGLIKYTGEVFGGDANGYGAMFFKDGSVYYGHFEHNAFNGQGVLIDMKDNTKKAGVFRNNQLSQPLDEKELDLIYGSKNGYGIKLTQNGRYQGNLENGIPHGMGMMDYYSGLLYVGEFAAGMANGDGMSEDRNTGQKYVGEFMDDAMTGKGIMYYPDGRKERGYFKDGVLSREKVTASIQKPTVSWSKPQLFTTTVSETEFKVSLCVSSRVTPDEVIIYDNNVVKAKKASRAFSVVNSQCDYTYEFTIPLTPGRNELRAVVKNEGGMSASDSRIVNLEIGDAVTNQKRVALIIGNSAYQNVAPLKNAANDAKLMSETLKNLGFTVITAIDADREIMRNKVYEFGDKIAEEKAVGLFFYAGHGIQVDGINYLVPITANIKRKEDVDEECFSIEKVLGQMTFAKNDLNIVILDACRDNPFANTSRAVKGEGGGLAQLNAPKGTFIAFSTSPGKTASDGNGENGLYTEQLAKAVLTPGARIEDVFKQVRNEVYRISSELNGEGNEQIPWENSSIFADFYFIK